MDKYIVKTSDRIFEFDKDPEDKNKYIVCCCAKNEDNYITEFIEHYILLGFDKIYIADNNDNDLLPQKLSKYIENGFVQIFPFNNYQGSFQPALFSTLLRECNFRWCAFYDCDEFLHLNKYNNIKDFLNTINEDVVLFNWLIYGSNMKLLKEDDYINNRFKLPFIPINGCIENSCIKSIVNGNSKEKFQNAFFYGSHIPVCDDENTITYNHGGYYVPNYRVGQSIFPLRYKEGFIKHYITKSFTEYDVKQKRGWPDGTTTLNIETFMMYHHYPRPLIDSGLYSPFSRLTTVFAYVNYNEIINALNDYQTIVLDLKFIDVHLVTKCLFDFLHTVNKHNFIFISDLIDDTLYDILLETGFMTNNNVIVLDSKTSEEELKRILSLYCLDDNYYRTTIPHEN